MDLIKTSKALSFGLRHNPYRVFGKNLDKEGYIDIPTVLVKLCVTREFLNKVVEENDKNRFEITDDKIRARQGHSLNVKIDLELKPTTPPEFLFHGTCDLYAQSIMKQGIKKMNRQHVHLSEDTNVAANVGARHMKGQNDLAILMIDALNMHQDGYVFYKSTNGVWLIDYVPTKYISWLE